MYPKTAKKETKETKETGQELEEVLTEDEQELPLLNEDLLKGWQIVKGTVKQLSITDAQIRKWFSRFNLEVGLADFDKVFPPEHLTNELLSKFQTILDMYRERQTKH